MTAAFFIVGAVCFFFGFTSCMLTYRIAEQSVMRRNRADLRIALKRRT